MARRTHQRVLIGATFLLAGCVGTSKPPTGELRACQYIIPERLYFTKDERDYLRQKPDLYVKIIEEQRQLSLANGDN